MQQNKKDNNKNILIVAVLSLTFMLLWQYFYEVPRQKRNALLQEAEFLDKPNTIKIQAKKDGESFIDNAPPALKDAKAGIQISFENDKVAGSINSNGLRMESLNLKDYKINDQEGFPLFTTSGAQEYFSQIGFISSDKSLTFPTGKTNWNLKKQDGNIIAVWKSPQNVAFEVTFTLDENYMFTILQKVKNLSKKNVPVSGFVKLLRSAPAHSEANMISHEGVVGYFGNKFNEIKYEKVKKNRKMYYAGESDVFWGGFSDKYWLSSFIYNNEVCLGETCSFINSVISLNYIMEDGKNKFQADFVTEEINIEPGQELIFASSLFAGAKELKLLDLYSAKGFASGNQTSAIPHFDKAVDFGIFYFLTKPIFLLITFLNSFLHNFGFSIILLTITIKLILFPIANKSYISTAKMKLIAPLVNEIRKKSGANKLEANKKVMELYRERDINPLSGCLPIFLQIPVFFALYKVLYISIEMRGAPFIFWIKDLSVKDPTSLFNMFGLLPFAVPAFLQIGILPILMGITTFLQQSLSPKSGDATQNMIIKFLPFMLIFVFAGFPSGIVLYWVTNNIFSIIQQLYVEKVVIPKNKEKNGLKVNLKR